MKYQDEETTFEFITDETITQDLVDLIITEKPAMLVMTEGEWMKSDEDEMLFCEHIKEHGPINNHGFEPVDAPSYHCKSAEFFYVRYSEKGETIVVNIVHV